MSAGRVIGGLIALIGGMFVLIMCIINMEAVFLMGGDALVAWLINLLLGLLALIGGIMGLASKKGGGLAVAAGLLVLFLGILSFAVLSLWTLFYQYSLFDTYMDIGKWAGITLESILMILGGIIMLASHK
ncbi:MAG: hypothetical protein LUQ65_07110 [Candidatus Helarchaeota archaeon]|nr:hypothetical protein [Candidatus Helarchaeota archaeon]